MNSREPPSVSRTCAASLIDSALSIETGDTLESSDWFPPPNDLEGIVQFNDGIMIGWVGNTLWHSEYELPHAWSRFNTKALMDDIVGAEVVSGMVVVGTKGRPYVGSGVDPASMNYRRLDIHAPLLGQRLICDAGSGVVYVADNGVMFITPGGPQWMTDTRYDKETWLQAVAPYDRAVYHDRRLILYAPDTYPLVLSMDSGSVEVSNLTLQFAAAYVADTHLTVIVRQDAPNNPARLRRYFNEGSERIPAFWRSGIIKITRPVNWAVAQLLADNYPVVFRLRHIRPGSYPAAPVGQPDLAVLSERYFTVNGPEPFWLPPDYLSREFELEVETNYRVQELALATSMEELVSS